MITFNALDFIPTVAAIRGDVLANRDLCKSNFARSVHDTLAGKLDEITADLHLEVATEQRLAAEKGTADGDDWYDIYHICTFFEQRWVEGGPISLADPIYEDVIFEGETCRVRLDYTLVPGRNLRDWPRSSIPSGARPTSSSSRRASELQERRRSRLRSPEGRLGPAFGSWSASRYTRLRKRWLRPRCFFPSVFPFARPLCAYEQERADRPPGLADERG